MRDNLGGMVPIDRASPKRLAELREIAEQMLKGVGDSSQFHEEASGYTYAYRRPANFAEEAQVAGIRQKRTGREWLEANG